jgi:uncharacterized protein
MLDLTPYRHRDSATHFRKKEPAMSDPASTPPSASAPAAASPSATPLDYAPSLPAGYVESDPAQRTIAMFLHIFACAVLIGPLVAYLTKRNDPNNTPYVKDQLKEVFNWGMTVGILYVVLIITFIGILLTPIVGIANLVFGIMNAIKANRGEVARYPWSIKFVK